MSLPSEYKVNSQAKLSSEAPGSINSSPARKSSAPTGSSIRDKLAFLESLATKPPESSDPSRLGERLGLNPAEIPNNATRIIQQVVGRAPPPPPPVRRPVSAAPDIAAHVTNEKSITAGKTASTASVSLKQTDPVPQQITKPVKVVENIIPVEPAPKLVPAVTNSKPMQAAATSKPAVEVEIEAVNMRPGRRLSSELPKPILKQRGSISIDEFVGNISLIWNIFV